MRGASDSTEPKANNVDEGVAAKIQDLETPTLPMTEAAYLPGIAYDEMFAPGGEVRSHYDPLHARMSTLGPANWRNASDPGALVPAAGHHLHGLWRRQHHRADHPDRPLSRIIPAQEWAKIEAGLTQRLLALNLFLSDIYGEQRILMDGVVPRELVLGAPSYRREMQHLYVPHKAYANVCGSDLIRCQDGSSRCWRTICASRPASPTCWPIATRPSAPSPAPIAPPACVRSSAIPTCCWRR
jgi:hypothetical protein